MAVTTNPQYTGVGGASIFTQQARNAAQQEELAVLSAMKAVAVAPQRNRVFASDSFWYAEIPANAALDANSPAYVAEFQRQLAAYGTVNLNTDSYSAPTYYVKSGLSATVTGPGASNSPIFQSANRTNVHPFDCQSKGYIDPNLTAQWINVPIPPGATPALGTDLEMCVYDLDTQTLYEFWQTQNVNGQWQACWGGSIQGTKTNSGIFQNPYGVTATGLPFIGGQITAEELSIGEINHVIGISLVDVANWDIFSWPATRSDGYNPANATNRIPEGTRFRLDPTLNLSTLGLNPVALVIAKAAQLYGFVVWDKAGSISLRLSNPMSYELAGLQNPYSFLFNGILSYSILSNFPWGGLQFLPQNYGKPA